MSADQKLTTSQAYSASLPRLCAGDWPEHEPCVERHLREATAKLTTLASTLAQTPAGRLRLLIRAAILEQSRSLDQPGSASIAEPAASIT